MNDEARDDERREPESGDHGDEQELTFEHGYGAQEGVLSEGESLEDVAGVSEKEVRDDLLGARQDDRGEVEEDEPEAEEREG